MTTHQPLACEPLLEQVTIASAACEDCLLTVSLLASLAVFASMADILDRLMASSLAHLELCDLFSNFHNNTSAFVACTFGAKLGHLRQVPVIHHEVDVAKAKASGIKLDKDIERTWSRLGICSYELAVAETSREQDGDWGQDCIPISGTGTFSTST